MMIASVCRLSVLHRHRLGTTAAQSYPAMFAKVRFETSMLFRTIRGDAC